MIATLLCLNACGYHLVGQGKSAVIPEHVTSADLTTNAGAKGKVLLSELQHSWTQYDTLPALRGNLDKEKHITMRIEHATETFVPVSFDSAGLAIQYKLQISAVLNMYQDETLIWGSGMMSVNASVFGDASTNNPSVVEAERETLTEQLNQQWAQDAIARLQSGF